MPDWANEAIVSNGTMEQIALFYHRMAADTPELARLKSGPFIKEMLDHFTKKIDSTLIPDRLLWFYSAHETTIGDLLNSLRLFEVILETALNILYCTKFQLFYFESL